MHPKYVLQDFGLWMIAGIFIALSLVACTLPPVSSVISIAISAVFMCSGLGIVLLMLLRYSQVVRKTAQMAEAASARVSFPVYGAQSSTRLREYSDIRARAVIVSNEKIDFYDLTSDGSVRLSRGIELSSVSRIRSERALGVMTYPILVIEVGGIEEIRLSPAKPRGIQWRFGINRSEMASVLGAFALLIGRERVSDLDDDSWSSIFVD